MATTVHPPTIRGLNDLRTKLVDEYVARNPASQNRYNAALEVMPGGNTRSVLHYDPFPMGIASGRECLVTSLDGDEYVDFVSEFSAAFFGHSNPDILKAIQSSTKNGVNLGGPGEAEIELARHIQSRFKSIEKLRFCNSGSEANTMALALATNLTGRKKIVAFKNGYHGGFITFGETPGPSTIPHQFVLGHYNDIESANSLIDNDVAAVIVEPMQGAGGAIPGTRDFLQALREATSKHGVVLIFDEVVTSRLHINGLQGYHGIYPDITTLGKYLGGGPSFGCFGGRTEIMNALDPRTGTMTHSGTYNNNVFTMAAGVAAAKILTQEKINKANQLGEKLRNGINKYDLPYIQSRGFGSVVGLGFHGQQAVPLADAFFFHMLSQNIYIGKRGFLSLNLAHEEEHVQKFLDAFDKFVKTVVPVSSSKL